MRIIENKFLSEKIFYEKLPNNMDLFFMPKEGFNKKYAIFATDYGSNDLEFINPHTKERVKVNEGIAHFLEHKVFEEESGEDAFLKFSKYGASANAFTNFDMTAYLFGATENFYESLEHLIRFVQSPYLTNENVEKEKGIIAQEIKMYEDNADWRLFFNTLRAMYKVHNNSVDIAGTVESIYKITVEELYNCYNTFYSPSNMALFIVGDLDIEEIKKTVKNTVSDINMFDGEIERLRKSEPKEINKKLIEAEMEVSIPMFTIGFKDEAIDDPKERLEKYLALDIAMSIIFGKTSRLHEELYSKGLIFSELAYEQNIHKDYFYSLISSETREVEKVHKIILDELERVKKEGLNANDFERVRKSKLGSFIKLFDSIESLANQYLAFHFQGIDLFWYYDMLNGMTLEKVNKEINNHFSEEQSVLSVVKPTKQ
ncbi:MAG: EF-P 5-aminopentanol modification-associated protein YfmH [Filifactoraceae bacterium]